MSRQVCEEPSCDDKTGAVELLITSRERDIGGFSVRRLLPTARRRLVGPFVFFDHMGPVDFPPGQGIDVRPHPHIGLATVTYLFEGEILHRDSLGTELPIRPGAVNWMTAGRGIVHSERSGAEARAGASRLNGIQSWVALPQAMENCAPAFDHHPADSLPLIEQDGVTMRLIAGTAYGASSPVAVYAPMFYLDAAMEAGAHLILPEEHSERALYVARGALSLGGERFETGSMAVFAPSAPVTLIAEATSRVMLFGGAAIDSKRHIWWNFVSSSRERIEQAKADWKADRFDPVPGETEFIPLPEN